MKQMRRVNKEQEGRSEQPGTRVASRPCRGTGGRLWPRYQCSLARQGTLARWRRPGLAVGMLPFLLVQTLLPAMAIPAWAESNAAAIPAWAESSASSPASGPNSTATRGSGSSFSKADGKSFEAREPAEGLHELAQAARLAGVTIPGLPADPLTATGLDRQTGLDRMNEEGQVQASASPAGNSLRLPASHNGASSAPFKAIEKVTGSSAQPDPFRLAAASPATARSAAASPATTRLAAAPPPAAAPKKLTTERVVRQPGPPGVTVRGLKIPPSRTLPCQDCSTTVLPLDLRRIPSEVELRRAGQLGGALDPIGPADPEQLTNQVNAELRAAGLPQGLNTTLPLNHPAAGALNQARERVQRAKAINMSFGQAMQLWNTHQFPQAANLFRKHLTDYPESPWGGETLLHLGCDAKYNGRFSEAASRYEFIIRNSDHRPGSPSREIALKARLRWADLMITMGRLGEAERELDTLLENDTDWRRRTWAKHWMFQVNKMKRSQRELAACGPAAVKALLAALGHALPEARSELAFPPPCASG